MPPRKRAPQVEVGSATEIATVPKTRNPFSLVKAVGAAGSDALSLIPGGLRVASQIVKDKSYEQYTRRGGFTLNAIDSA